MKRTILGTVTTLICCVLLMAVTAGCKESGEVDQETIATIETDQEAADTKKNNEEAIAIEETTIAEDAVTITDGFGREVTITLPVEKICFSFYGTGEAIKVIGAWDKVISTDYYTRNEWLFPDAADMPLINGEIGLYDVDLEKVLELQPDVFITKPESWAQDDFDKIVDILEPDIPVVALEVNDPESIVENIEKLGMIVGYEDGAYEFNKFYQDIENLISSRTDTLLDEQKPRVFIKATGWSPDDFSTFTDEYPGISSRIEVPGGVNIAGTLMDASDGFVQNIDPEWLLELNSEIDIIIANVWEVYAPGVLGFDVNDDSAALAFRDEVMSLDVLADSRAVQEDRVYLNEDDMWGTPRLIIGMAYMAKWFHPGLFEDMDPKALHQDYLTRFMDIDFDLDEGGVFFYPEP